MCLLDESSHVIMQRATPKRLIETTPNSGGAHAVAKVTFETRRRTHSENEDDRKPETNLHDGNRGCIWCCMTNAIPTNQRNKQPHQSRKMQRTCRQAHDQSQKHPARDGETRHPTGTETRHSAECRFPEPPTPRQNTSCEIVYILTANPLHSHLSLKISETSAALFCLV
jgi:hypothetical protein